MKASEIQSDKLKRKAKKNSSKRAHFKVDRIISSRSSLPLLAHKHTYLSLCTRHSLDIDVPTKKEISFIHFFAYFNITLTAVVVEATSKKESRQ
jgi:hypothetical protein